jgi:hypothetical protein
LPWFLQNFLEVGGWGVDGWFFLVLVTISYLIWVVDLLELVKYFVY